ncbi:hypothetical protein [Actinomadura rupiterrae]|uniref:hypothetical protein n=1 Tax=Actinomadura rupiterrae TaxID=559627 RepID=UPI0020A36E73|nr:hypothetical protein [Actinomadura rupiterrae]MCP2337929.1 hypothetical protein [Actinomadura rupiterrae]
MSLPLIAHHLDTLAGARSVPHRLAASYCALELVEAAVQELGFLDAPDPPPRWAAIHWHAAQARALLADAPSIDWPLTVPPPTVALAVHDVATVTGRLIDLGETLTEVLLATAREAENAADVLCALKAALRVQALTAELHYSRALGTH